MKKKIVWLLIALVISLSVNSCKSVPIIPTITIPESVTKPVLVKVMEDGSFILVEPTDTFSEKDYYIIYNPTTKEHYRVNFIVMMNYAERLEDYIKLLTDQIEKAQ